jgi:hypothetical protein
MIERHPDESAKAWRGYCCYQNLGPERTIALAYAIYRQVDQDPSESPVIKPSASFIGWKSEFNWDERVKAWDASEEEIARNRQRAIDDEAYQAELELFRQIQLNAGKKGVAIVLTLKKVLSDWIETHPPIESWREALMATRIIATLEMSSSEQWAKSIHIDLLLAEMNDSEMDD